MTSFVRGHLGPVCSRILKVLLTRDGTLSSSAACCPSITISLLRIFALSGSDTPTRSCHGREQHGLSAAFYEALASAHSFHLQLASAPDAAALLQYWGD